MLTYAGLRSQRRHWVLECSLRALVDASLCFRRLVHVEQQSEQIQGYIKIEMISSKSLEISRLRYNDVAHLA
jgi:hypothetical protein